MVAAKLHNYVIDKDNLQFHAAEDYELFGVEPLINGPDNNHGYLPTLPICDAQLDNVDSAWRHAIVGELKARDMTRPLYNILRNHDDVLDDDTVYKEE